MASEKTKPDEELAPDPFEAELVAYLDGELDEASARQVEARLARDPAARARAAELKKSFDLLDYLPRPEPSATFTTRTLDKLPAVKPATDSAQGRKVSPSRSATQSATPSGNQVVSSSVPVPLELDETPEPRPGRSRLHLWLVGISALVGFAVIGYFGSALARPYLFPRKTETEESKIDVDPRVIERLPLYAVADDLAFVTELAKPEYFGSDPAVLFNPTLKVPASDSLEKPAGKQFEVLTKAFRSLPAARQTEIVKLDHDLQNLEPKERDRLFRVLEVYAAWVERLPDFERRAVLHAATSSLRLGVIRTIRAEQWVNALPAGVRTKPELIQKWKDEETRRSERWASVRHHAETLAATKTPWPFNTEAGRKEVIEYARNAFKIDDSKKCRLSPVDLAEYRRTLADARRDDTWAWYGLLVYELCKHHPYLPEPENSKLMITELNELPEAYAKVIAKKGGALRIRATVIGKWPEFPLEVHELRLPKLLPPNPPPLGPSRLTEFKKPVRDFATNELFPKMTPKEKHDLDLLQGKWPEYPREILKYAYKHNLSVPGVTLPGPPKKWDATYDLHVGTDSNK